MGNLSILDLIIYTLLPFGQVFSRVINYNGSLDLWWLLLIPFFHIPLIGIIPLLIMKLLNISDGKVSSPVLDKYVWLPILFKFYSPYLLPLLGLETHTAEYLTITATIQIIIGMISNMSRRNALCNNPINVNAISKSFMDATISHNCGELMIYIITLIPIINNGYINSRPYVGEFLNSIMWTIGYLLIYTINNMYNEYDKDKFCSIPFLGNSQDMFLFLGSIFILFTIKYNNIFLNNSVVNNLSIRNNKHLNIWR